MLLHLLAVVPIEIADGTTTVRTTRAQSKDETNQDGQNELYLSCTHRHAHASATPRHSVARNQWIPVHRGGRLRRKPISTVPLILQTFHPENLECCGIHKLGELVSMFCSYRGKKG